MQSCFISQILKYVWDNITLDDEQEDIAWIQLVSARIMTDASQLLKMYLEML
jgi:hypothetical protein